MIFCLSDLSAMIQRWIIILHMTDGSSSEFTWHKISTVLQTQGCENFAWSLALSRAEFSYKNTVFRQWEFLQGFDQSEDTWVVFKIILYSPRM